MGKNDTNDSNSQDAALFRSAVGEVRPLRTDERERLLDQLETQKSMTWNVVRRCLGLHSGEKFNLEEGAKAETGLKGLHTIASLHTILGSGYSSIHDRIEQLAEDLSTLGNTHSASATAGSRLDHDGEAHLFCD